MCWGREWDSPLLETTKMMYSSKASGRCSPISSHSSSTASSATWRGELCCWEGAPGTGLCHPTAGSSQGDAPARGSALLLSLSLRLQAPWSLELTWRDCPAPLGDSAGTRKCPEMRVPLQASSLGARSGGPRRLAPLRHQTPSAAEPWEPPAHFVGLQIGTSTHAGSQRHWSLANGVNPEHRLAGRGAAPACWPKAWSTGSNPGSLGPSSGCAQQPRCAQPSPHPLNPPPLHVCCRVKGGRCFLEANPFSPPPQAVGGWGHLGAFGGGSEWSLGDPSLSTLVHGKLPTPPNQAWGGKGCRAWIPCPPSPTYRTGFDLQVLLDATRQEEQLSFRTPSGLRRRSMKASEPGNPLAGPGGHKCSVPPAPTATMGSSALGRPAPRASTLEIGSWERT